VKSLNFLELFLLRTHSCGELRKEHIGSEVSLTGWVNRRRDHGGLIFIDLRDRDGVVQTVFNPEISSSSLHMAEEMRSEYVVRVKGEVAQRPAGTENTRLPTGDIEVIVKESEILNTSEIPPFYINEEVEVDESLRLKYRYLDLRRPRMQQIIMLRHRVIKFMRDFLDARGFVEVETPILLKSTPEGARDFLVPSRLRPGEFYALPQSPQQIKQLLMVAGMDRYYQIARCFRDEDSRADRQFEFTQLDIEMSFIDEEDILALIEELLTKMVPAVKPDMKVTTPFPRFSYDDAMERYGSDKPDVRFDMELKDLSAIVTNSQFEVFSSALESGGVVKGICIPECAGYSRRQLDDLTRIARDFGAGGLVTIALAGEVTGLDDITEDMVKSAVIKYLPLEQVKEIARHMDASVGDLILIVAGEKKMVNTVLGELRREMGVRLKLADPDLLTFAFVLDFPLFERDKTTGRLDATHHPFTMPHVDDIALLDTTPEKVRSRAYDITCNGYELGSGSIRIHHAELQRKMLRIIGYGDDVIDERFGHLLEAFNYGAPPHGGFAPGIDRIVMLLAGEENIREVIAFPKTQSGVDLTFGAPSPVVEEQLAELHLQLRDE
jgi:aspartyl-tRNA synthetase